MAQNNQNKQLWLEFRNDQLVLINTHLDSLLNARPVALDKVAHLIAHFFPNATPEEMSQYSLHSSSGVSYKSSDSLAVLGENGSESNPLVIYSNWGKNKDRMPILKRLLFYTSTLNNITQERTYGCVTAYQKRKLATFQHGCHSLYKLGDTLTIYSVENDAPSTVVVTKVDQLLDLVLLECAVDLCLFVFRRSLPYEGQYYFQLGLSATHTSQDKSRFYISRGVITSTRLTSNGQILGSDDINPGECGGGCFAEHENLLYGINVGCESSGGTTLDQMTSRFPARVHIVPCNNFV